MNSKTPALLSYAFRPFFLMNGIFAILVVLLWMMVLYGYGPPNITVLWHAHEMLIGFALATVAGFSLTAVANWTGRPAIKGMLLAYLVISWFIGRLAMLFSGWLPMSLVLILDQLFPVLLLVLLGREIIGGRSRRNYPLVAILLLIVLLNTLYHLGTNLVIPGGNRLAVFLLIHTLVLLVVIIAGRIVPAFTGNWLRSTGQTDMPVNRDWLNTTSLWLTIFVGLSASFSPAHSLTGILAFAAALIHGLRLSGWKGFATISNPMLFILHIAYLWLPLAYALLGCAVFGWLFTSTAALHAFTMGAIGSMVLAVTTRVALGHTGRPLQAARLTVIAYWFFMIATLIRVFGPLTGVEYMQVINWSAIGWIAAFSIFTWVYWPILTRPKIEA